MKWNIVADSSIDIFLPDKKPDCVEFFTVPFVLNVDGKEFVDDEKLDIGGMMAAMKASKKASSSSCPSPGTWREYFLREGNTLAITITSGISGSYNSAMTARSMVMDECPGKNIEVIDSLSTGPALILILRKLLHLISEGLDFDGVMKAIDEFRKHSFTSFVLASYDNLIKNGRMNRIAGLIAGRIGIHGIGIASPEGTIDIKGIARSRKKAIHVVIEDMKHRAGQVKEVVIDHCFNNESALLLKEAILSVWKDASITICSTRGLCSYYAENGGLIIGFSSESTM